MAKTKKIIRTGIKTSYSDDIPLKCVNDVMISDSADNCGIWISDILGKFSDTTHLKITIEAIPESKDIDSAFSEDDPV